MKALIFRCSAVGIVSLGMPELNSLSILIRDFHKKKEDDGGAYLLFFRKVYANYLFQSSFSIVSLVWHSRMPTNLQFTLFSLLIRIDTTTSSLDSLFGFFLVCFFKFYPVEGLISRCNP